MAPVTPDATHDDCPRSLPKWLWVGAAPLIVLAQVLLKAFDEERYRHLMRGEFGLVENCTVLFLLLACIASVWMFRMRARVTSRLFGPFAVVMALGCLFFAGEEASWGQHWIGFEPPEALAERNEQGEFNLHNDPLLETLLDQLPRNLLTLAG